MTVTTRTWRRSQLYNNATFTIAGILAALKAAIDAEVAAYPSAALWEVADYSVGNGTLTLKRTANGTGGQGRIMIFGGQSPHTLAVDGAAAATTSLYGGFAESASAPDAPEVSYASGKPYTTGDWIPGGRIILTSDLASIERVEWFEHEEGIFICFRLAIMNAASAIATFFAGHMGVSVDGQTAYAMAGGSSSLLVGTQDTATTGAAGLILSRGTEATTTNTRTNYRESSAAVRRCRLLQVVPATTIIDALRDTGSKRYFYPIYMRNSDELRTIIKLRQIGVGILEAHGQTMNTATLTPACHRLGIRTDQADVGLWLLNVLT